MKNMKLLIVFMVAILLTAQITTAQEGTEHNSRSGERMERMKAELDLTDTQMAQMKELKATFRAKMETLKGEEGDWSEKREAFRKLKEAQREATKKILTAEQQAKVEAHKAERQAKKEAMREKIKSVDKEAMKAEMKAYKKENIHPTVLKQRLKLEASISAADKREIEALRPVLKTIKKERKEKYRQFKESGQRPTEAQREAMKTEMEQHRVHFEKARALTEKYATQIDALFAEIADEKEQWGEDMGDIKNKYFGELMEEMGEHQGKGKFHGRKGGKAACAKGEAGKCEGKRGHKRPRGGKMGHHSKGDNHQRVKFLMMEVNGKTKADKPRIKGKKASTLKVYPNPSFTTNTLEYTIEKAGTVRIELHDKQGNVVKQISSEYKQPGIYKEQVSLSGLRGVVYFYVITDDNGVRSQKFMVRK